MYKVEKQLFEFIVNQFSRTVLWYHLCNIGKTVQMKDERFTVKMTGKKRYTPNLAAPKQIVIIKEIHALAKFKVFYTSTRWQYVSYRKSTELWLVEL